MHGGGAAYQRRVPGLIGRRYHARRLRAARPSAARFSLELWLGSERENRRVISHNCQYGTGAGAAGLARSNKPLAQSSKASGFFSANNPAPRTVGAIPVPNLLACNVAYQERQQADGLPFLSPVTSPMPRFYFDLVLGAFTNRDEVGYQIDSLHVAEI